MGKNISKEQKDIFVYLKSLLIKNNFNVPDKKLRDLLIYVQKNFPNTDLDSALSRSLWDQIGRKPLDDTTLGDKKASLLLPPQILITES